MTRSWHPSSLAVTAFLAIGFAAGALFRPESRHQSCVSDKQFITEFRLRDANLYAAVPGLVRASLNQPEVLLEIDGKARGKLSQIFDPPIREFLCEGTHEAVLSFPSNWPPHPKERHRIRFLVSRPSLFHATQWKKEDGEESSCITDACVFNVGMELSPLDPDKQASLEYAASLSQVTNR